MPGLTLCALRAAPAAPALQWYTEAEKTNGRWAMAAVAGILFTEILGKGKWFEVSAELRVCSKQCNEKRLGCMGTGTGWSRVGWAGQEGA